MCAGCTPRPLPVRAKCLQISLLYVRPPEDLRLVRPVILLRGLPATAGSLRRFQADSRAGCARGEKKPAVIMSNTYANLQDFTGATGLEPATSGVIDAVLPSLRRLPPHGCGDDFRRLLLVCCPRRSRTACDRLQPRGSKKAPSCVVCDDNICRGRRRVRIPEGPHPPLAMM